MPTTTFPEVKDATLQKLCAAVFDSIRQPGGTILTAFKDSQGNTVVANSQLSGGVANTASQAGPGREVVLEVRINPDGLSASAKVVAKNPAGLQSVGGAMDISVLATKLV